MPTLRLSAVAAVAALCWATACTRRVKTPRERGAGTFLRLCSGCHGQDAKGTKKPGFVVQPRNLTDPKLQQRLSDADIRRTIRQGKGQMPPFGKFLPEEEIDDLVAFIRSINAAPSPGSTSPG